MSDEELDGLGLDHIDAGRRSFLKKMVIGTAFAVPAIASFNMVGLSASSADGLTSNQPIPLLIINDLCKIPAVQHLVAEQFGGPANHAHCVVTLENVLNHGAP
jgi:hypothetical protein